MKGNVGVYWNKIFMEISALLFRVSVTWFFFLPFCPASLTENIVLITFWYGLKHLADKVVLDR